MLLATSYEDLFSTTCWICFKRLLAKEQLIRLSTCGHRFHLQCLLVHVHNVPHTICLVCHTQSEDASRPVGEVTNMVQEFSRALQTYHNSLQFYRSQEQRLCTAMDMVANSIPEASAILEDTRSDGAVLSARLFHMRTVLAQSQHRRQQNEVYIEEMWKIQWCVDRQYTFIKQLDAACQTHRITEQALESSPTDEALKEEEAQGVRLTAQHDALQHENEQLRATVDKAIRVCSRLQRETAYEMERVFSPCDMRPHIGHGTGCRFCGYDNRSTGDCAACLALYRTGHCESEGRKRAIRGILSRVAIDSQTYCSEQHLGCLSLDALRVLCHRLQIIY